MTEKPTEIGHFWNVQILDQISLIECIFVSTYPNHLVLFFQYIPN
jgi:hypothetical protein